MDHRVHRPQRGQAVISDTCIVAKSFYVCVMKDFNNKVTKGSLQNKSVTFFYIGGGQDQSSLHFFSKTWSKMA